MSFLSFLDEKGNPFPNKDDTSKGKVCAPSKNLFSIIPEDEHNFPSGASSSTTMADIFKLAIENDGGIEKEEVSTFRGDIYKWEEELIHGE